MSVQAPGKVPAHSGSGSRFQSIIAPLDLTPEGDRALPVVQALAVLGGVPVHLVTTTSPGLDPACDEADLAVRARGLGGRDVTRHVITTPEPADGLAQFATAHPGSVVCVASHGRTAVGEMLLGSMTQELLHRGVGPVLAIGPHADLEVSSTMRLLVCVDEFVDPAALASVVGKWQTTFGGIVEVFEAVDDDHDVNVPQPSEVRRVANVLGGTDITVTASHDPARAIIDAAADAGTVVVVASHHRRGLRRAVLGSVSSEVVRHAKAPVLFVPTKEGRTS